MNRWRPVNHPRILGIGTANPPIRLTQEQSFHAAGYQGERIRKIFLNSDIDYRHFYLEGAPNREESSDQLNQRYLRGAMKTGCRAILNCVEGSRNYRAGCRFPCSLHVHWLRVSGCGQSSHRTHGLQQQGAKGVHHWAWMCGCASHIAAGSRFRSRKSGPPSINASRRDLLSLLLRR